MISQRDSVIITIPRIPRPLHYIFVVELKLGFHSRNGEIFRNPRGHLSANHVSYVAGRAAGCAAFYYHYRRPPFGEAGNRL